VYGNYIAVTTVRAGWSAAELLKNWHCVSVEVAWLSHSGHLTVKLKTVVDRAFCLAATSRRQGTLSCMDTDIDQVAVSALFRSHRVAVIKACICRVLCYFKYFKGRRLWPKANRSQAVAGFTKVTRLCTLYSVSWTVCISPNPHGILREQGNKR